MPNIINPSLQILKVREVFEKIAGAIHEMPVYKQQPYVDYLNLITRTGNVLAETPELSAQAKEFSVLEYYDDVGKRVGLELDKPKNKAGLKGTIHNIFNGLAAMTIALAEESQERTVDRRSINRLTWIARLTPDFLISPSLVEKRNQELATLAKLSP